MADGPGVDGNRFGSAAADYAVHRADFPTAGIDRMVALGIDHLAAGYFACGDHGGHLRARPLPELVTHGGNLASVSRARGTGCRRRAATEWSWSTRRSAIGLVRRSC